jgi:hypothetical protein
MKWIKTYEGKLNDKIMEWVKDTKVVDANGLSIIVYHTTDKDFKKFSSKKSAMGGIIWFTNDLESIEKGEVGASGYGFIKKMYVKIINPAGWNEYEKYTLGQLDGLKYDGVILPSKDGKFDGFVFNTNQIRIIR